MKRRSIFTAAMTALLFTTLFGAGSSKSTTTINTKWQNLFKYVKPYNFSGGLAPIATDRGWGLIDKKGKIDIAPVYKNIPSDFYSEGIFCLAKYDKAKQHDVFIFATIRALQSPKLLMIINFFQKALLLLEKMEKQGT